ncbi:S8 family serine peptidase [Enterococcus sp. LJL128]
MAKKIKKILLAIPILIAAAVALLAIYVFWIQPVTTRTAGTDIDIARRVEANQQNVEKLTKLPRYDETAAEPVQLDFRSKDLSELNLEGKLLELEHGMFSNETIWPTVLPQEYNPDIVFENGKNPGLSIRALHEAGITGAGVSIGIIDQTLYTEHSEYKSKLKHYEEIHALSKIPEMHGAAVASLAVGETTGVSPSSDLYFIASALSDNLGTMLWARGQDSKGIDYSRGITYRYYAEAIQRFLELNETLSEKEKIRVISISRGFNKLDDGYKEFHAAVKKAKDKGIFVVTATLLNDYDVGLAGLGKTAMGDPDELASYSVGSWMKEDAEDYQNYLFVPMDGRTYAGTNGAVNYQYDPVGGLSWTIPYLAGVYALACQVNPAITPELFLETAVETADSLIVDNNGASFQIKYLLNPTKLIEKLKVQDTISR